MKKYNKNNSIFIQLFALPVLALIFISFFHPYINTVFADHYCDFSINHCSTTEANLTISWCSYPPAWGYCLNMTYRSSCAVTAPNTCAGSSYSGWKYDSNCGGVNCADYPSGGGPTSIGCCLSGEPSEPSCTKDCGTAPYCNVTDDMCAAANGNNSNYDAYTTSPGNAYCKGTSATCSVDSNCPDDPCESTEYCYRAANCLTNCTLPSCTSTETSTPTPTPRPEGCAPRAISCSNLTDCALDNDCPDSTGSCYPLGACQSCTPTTPSGFHIPISGETTNETLSECKTKNRCDKKYLCSQGLCGDPTYVENTFYRDERNTTNPASPTAPRMTIDGINFPLSTDSSTRIKKPLPTSAENTVNFTITGITVDTDIAFGPFYDYIAENKGVSNAWLDSTPFDCNGTANEDFCFWRDTSTTKEFHGTFVGHKTPTQILLEGAEGTVAFRSVSTDRCTSSSKYSAWTFPRYKVNNLPKVTEVLITGNDKYRGCQATATYTGLNANNPLTITIKGTDADGLADINGAIIWLVKEGSALTNDIDKLTYFTAATPRTDANKIGILVRRDNTNTYVANIVGGALSNWGAGTEVLHSSEQVVVSTITNINPHEGTGRDWGLYIFEIELEFPKDESPLLSGKYNVYAALTDGLTYNTYLDQQNVVDSGKNWIFDFVNPTISSLTNSPILPDSSQRVVTTTFISDDINSGIKDTVFNVYISSNPSKIKLIEPVKPEITPALNPTVNNGSIDRLESGWVFLNSKINQFKTDIQQNSSGNISFYPTVYDKACNYFTPSTPVSLDLNRWIATKGGILFSQGGIAYIPKLVSNYNLGTELISFSTENEYGIRNISEAENPTKVLSAIDTNYTGRGNLFELLKERAIFYNNKYKYPVKVPQEQLDFTQCSNIDEIDEICVFWRDGNLTIGTDGLVTTYSGKKLIYASGNITIYPDVKANDPAKDGLIILAGGDITIGGNDHNQTPVYTDEIDALLLANRAISIPVEDSAFDDPSRQQDSLKITGSMLALGVGNPDRSFNLLRNLGLLNPIHPVLIVNYHPKYAKISELFFGTDNKIYKQEVGFKL